MRNFLRHLSVLLFGVLLVLFSAKAVKAQLHADAGPDQTVCDGLATLTATDPTPNAGQWSVVMGDAVILNATDPYTEAQNLSHGQNVLVWTVTSSYGTTVSDTVVITNLSVEANAGTDQYICEGTTTLFANQTSATETGTWRVIGGSGTISSPYSNQTLVTNLAQGENKFEWKVTNGQCTAISYVNIYTTQMGVDAGPDRQICADEAMLQAQDPTPYYGFWEGVGTDAYIEMNNMHYTKVYDLQPGQNVFRWTVEDGNCTVSDEVTLTNLKITAETGPDREICENQTYINAILPAATATGQWSLAAGSADIETPNNPQTLVTNLAPGANTFLWEIDNNGCISQATQTIVNNAVFADAGQDQTICETTTELTAREAPPGATGVWSTAMNTPAIIANSTFHNTPVSDLKPGKNYFRWEVMRGICIATDYVEISNMYVHADAGEDKTVCADQAIMAANHPPATATGHWEIIQGEAFIDNPQDPNTLIFDITANTNRFRWVIDNNGCISFDEVVIQSALGTATEVSAGTDMEICGQEITLNSDGTSGYWEVVQGHALINDPTSPTSTASGFAYGENILRWHEDQNGCIVSDDVVITNNQVKALVEENISVCENSAQLFAEPPSNFSATASGQWTTVGGQQEIATPEAHDTWVHNLQTGQNIFRWTTNNNGCTDYAEMTVTSSYFSVSAGTDQVICTNDFTANATDPATFNGVGEWSILQGNASADDPFAHNTYVYDIAPGENKFIWTVTAMGCTQSDTVTITNSTPFPISQNEGYLEVCSDEVMLHVPPLEVGTGSWMAFGNFPELIIDSPNSPSTLARNLPAGEVQFRWIAENNGCLDSTIFYVNSYFQEGMTVEYDTVCTPEYDLSAPTPSGDPFAEWSIIAGNAQIQDPTMNTTTAYNLSPGLNVFRWEVNTMGCTSFKEVNVWFSGVQAKPGQDFEVCADHTRLAAEEPVNGTGNWTALTGGSILDPANPRSKVENLMMGTNQFNWTVTSHDGYCTADSVLTIIYNMAEQAHAGEDIEGCAYEATLSATAPSMGIGEWVPLGPTYVNDPQNPSSTVGGLMQGDNGFVWYVTSNGCTTSDTVWVQNNEVYADAGLDETVCNSSAVLAGNRPPQGATGNWSIVSGGAGVVIDSPELFNTTVSNLPDGTVTFEWTITNGACVASDMVNIHNVGGTNSTNAGADDAVCADMTTLAAAMPPAGATGYWSVVDGYGMFDDPTSFSTTVNYLNPGENVFRWTVNFSGNCTASDDVVITNDIPEKPIVAPDFTTCEPQATIKAEHPVGMGIWSSVTSNPNLSYSDPSNPECDVFNLMPGQNTFTWGVSQNGCTQTDTINVFYTSPMVNILGDGDTTVCTPDIVLSATHAAMAEIQWYIIGGNAIITDPYQATAEVMNLSPGMNLFKFSASIDGCYEEDFIEVINDAPTVANAGPDQYVCKQQTILQGNTPLRGEGSWKKENILTVINDPTSPTTQVTGLQNSNPFVWSIATANCVTHDTVFVFNNSLNASASAENNIVCDAEATLSGNMIMGGTGYWSITAGEGVVENSQAMTTIVSDLAPGLNIFEWTISKNGCIDSDRVLVYNKQVSQANVGPDRTVCREETILLANNPVYGSGQWSTTSSAVIHNPSAPATLVTNLSPGVNSFVWTISKNMCSSSDEVRITSAPVTAIAGPDTALCRDSALILAIDPPVGTGHWSIVAGNGIILNTMSNISKVKNLSFGANTFRWTVSNGVCSDYDEQTIRNNIVVAEFDAETVGEEVQFTDFSLGNKTAWLWNFGDGATSDLQNPMHAYNITDVYDVCLTVYSENSTCLDEMCKEVTFGNVDCYADFTYEESPATPGEFQFTDASSPTITDWRWEFDDGTTYTTQNPSHSLDPGLHIVKLSVLDSDAQCEDMQIKEISVGAELQADFDFFPQGLEVIFLDQSAGEITDWYWTVNDTFFTQQELTYTFDQAGIYPVCLQVLNQNTQEGSIKCRPVVVGDNSCYVESKFVYFVEPNNTVRVRQKAIGENLKFFWHFGDGHTSTQLQTTHTYDAPGYRLITLAVRDTVNGCMDMASQLVQVGQGELTADFRAIVTDNATNTVNFIDESVGDVAYRFWTFDDGTHDVGANVTHSFDTPGLHFATLAVSSPTGAVDVKTKPVQVGQVQCNAMFEYFVDADQNRVEFFNAPQSPSTILTWTFGDGGGSQASNPSHVYTAPGYYPVHLRTFNPVNGCSDHYHEVILVGQEGIDCEADFAYQNDLTSNVVNFFDRSQGENLSYHWNFGDGNELDDQANPTHEYAEPGFYDVCLTVTTGSGISNTTCLRVGVASNDMFVNAQFSYVVDSATRTVNYFDESFGDPDKWTWLLGDGTTAIEANPVHTYADTGVYMVQLIAENTTTGRKSYFADMVNVGATPGLRAGFNYDVDEKGNDEKGYPVDYVGAAFGDAATTQYDFGDEKVSQEGVFNITHTYASEGTYNVCFTVSDPVTGQTATDCQLVKVGSGGTNITLPNTDRFSLGTYPNPFAQYTNIVYTMPEAAEVELAVYDLVGHKIKTLIKTYKDKGRHDLIWNGSQLDKGVYYLRLTMPNHTVTTKVIIAK